MQASSKADKSHVLRVNESLSNFVGDEPSFGRGSQHHQQQDPTKVRDVSRNNDLTGLCPSTSMLLGSNLNDVSSLHEPTLLGERLSAEQRKSASLVADED